MNIFQDEHIEVLNLLLEENVEFLIVGGFAVNFYGYRRSTGDVDLWLKPDNFNKSKLIKVFNRMDIEYTDIQHLESLDFESHLAFHVGVQNSATVPPFRSVWSQAVTLGGVFYQK